MLEEFIRQRNSLQWTTVHIAWKMPCSCPLKKLKKSKIPQVAQKPYSAYALLAYPLYITRCEITGLALNK